MFITKKGHRLVSFKLVAGRELDIITEMIRQTLMRGAFATVSEEEYRRRLGDLTDRFRTEEEKLKRLTAERKKRDAESVAIGGRLFELTEPPRTAHLI